MTTSHQKLRVDIFTYINSVILPYRRYRSLHPIAVSGTCTYMRIMQFQTDCLPIFSYSSYIGSTLIFHQEYFPEWFNQNIWNWDNLFSILKEIEVMECICFHTFSKWIRYNALEVSTCRHEDTPLENRCEQVTLWKPMVQNLCLPWLWFESRTLESTDHYLLYSSYAQM